jgi:hypothetical protein
MSEAQRKATKGVLQRIADAIKGRPAGGTPDWIPSTSHGNERLPSADPQVRERGSRYQQSEADKARDAAREAAVKKRNERFDTAPKGAKQQRAIDDAIYDYQEEMKRLKPRSGDVTDDGRIVHVPNERYSGHSSHTPADLEKGRGPIPDPNKKGVRIFRPKKYGEGTSKDFFDKVAQESKEFYQKTPKQVAEFKSFSEVGEKAVGDIAKIGLAGGTTAGVVGSGVSYWTKKKESDRGGQK